MATITDDDGDHILIGTDTLDFLEALIGDYKFDGGAGSDTLFFSEPLSIRIDLNQTGPQYVGFGTYEISSIENIFTDAGNDYLKGNSAANALYAGAGNDTVYGGGGSDVILGEAGKDRLYGDAGNDILSGGAGNDTLTGGRGKDLFLFSGARASKTNVDKITDFSVRDDAMLLDRAFFTKLGKKGVLPEEAFYTGTAAHDASDRVIYNPDTGALYYDRDGTGGAAAVLFARIKPGLALTHKDFFTV
ncbi:calcium-binding protein [Microvirga flavescens]|uniref:calcium-binding protein n=1 Tax=Microvirga flavescens TaxID=2249811 RepID=UPI000DDAF04C|nr:calcium-binding protein [Microvirga flavescens]